MTVSEPKVSPLWKKLLFPAILLLLIAGGVAGSMLATRDPQTHVHGWLDRLLWQRIPAPDFTLTDHNGEPVRLSQFRGKVVVFSFGFTHCPNICPATLSHFSAIREAVPEPIRHQVQFLFITVDPERDSPERLKEYVPFFDPHFLGLIGTPEEVRDVVYRYKASFRHGKPRAGDPKDYFVDHTADAFLIGPDGQWELSYPFEELPKTERIAADIARLVNVGGGPREARRRD